MSHNTKIILVVGGTLICSCALLFAATLILGRNFVRDTQDSANIQRIASEIADFTLPPGYRGLIGYDLFDYKMIIYVAGSGNLEMGNVLSLTQFNQQNLDAARMVQLVELGAGITCQRSRAIGQEMLNVKGSPHLFSISECNSQGVPTHEIIGTFHGRGGLTTVMGIGPASSWDQDAFRRFVESIR